MRILILTKKLPFPTHDGESIAIMQLATHFHSLGVEVHMLSMQTNKHHFNVDQIPTHILKSIQLSSVFVHNNISYFQILKNFFKRIPYQFERFYSKDFIEALNSILDKNTFDIIQLEGFFLSSYIPEIREKSMAKVILRSHNIENRIWKSYAKKERNWVKKIFFLYQSRKMYRYEKLHSSDADAIISISLSDLEWYKKNTPIQKLKYIPCGFDTHSFSQQNRSDSGQFYFIGGLDWLPNIQGITWFIQQVLPLILIKKPNFKLHIAGRNASINLISQFQDPIIYYGEVENASSFIQDKEFCIVPLLSGSGMKIKIVEAMMHKKIIISTSVGIEGFPEEVKNIVFVENSPQGFANSIIQCMENTSDLLLKKEESYLFALNHFDSKVLSSSLIQYYNTL